MSVRSFRPVLSVATVAFAALSCYLVSLRVAAERAGLEDVETKIVLAQRDIRTLQTEIGTRGRLEQLERWNVKVLALSAPKADQFVDGGYQLARLARPSDEVDMTAPVVLASAPKTAAPIVNDDADVAATQTAAPSMPRAAPRNDGAASLMHVASYRVTTIDKSVEPRTPTTSVKAAPAKLSRVPAQAVSATTKPVRIATAVVRKALPGTDTDANASPHHEPAKPGASRNKATH